MVIKTLSQLPTATYNTLTDTEKTYMEISQHNGNSAYVSRKISVKDLNMKGTSDLSNAIVSQYGLKDGETNISLKEQRNRITQLSASDTTLYGAKHFDTYPYVVSSDFPTSFERYGGSRDYVLPNVGIVKKMITDTPAFISDTSSLIAGGCPFQSEGGTPICNGSSIRYDTFFNNESFYMWRIEDGDTDSRNTSWDAVSDTKGDYETIKDDGWLVVWGWLRDNGNVAADMAWTGLFAQLKWEGQDTASNTSTAEVPLQIQPWVRGSNALDMQYVGFNIPVKAGLRLFIKTGFPVNKGSGGHQQGGSLTFQDGWIPNTFVGYVIKHM